MAQTLIQSAGLSNFDANVTNYIPFGSADVVTGITTEANAQVPLRTAGTLSNMHINIPSKGANATLSATLRIDG